MNLTHSPKLGLLLTVLLAALAFGLAFHISYQEDQNGISEIGDLSWTHLHYAQELKDDMAVIDWSKGLEKLDNVRAFQVQLDSKTIAEGGNRNFLPLNIQEGVSYHFPSDWSYRKLSPKGSPVLDFVLLYHSWPGPLLWGLFAFFSSLITGLLLRALDGKLKSKSPNTPREIPLSRPSSKPVAPPTPPRTPIKTNSPALYIDKNFIVQQETNGAAAILKRAPDLLINNHIIDLTPSPLLLQAMEKSEEAKIQNPFPGISASQALLKPEADGFWLILEDSSPAKSP